MARGETLANRATSGEDAQAAAGGRVPFGCVDSGARVQMINSLERRLVGRTPLFASQPRPEDLREIAAMSDEPSGPDEVEITAAEYIGKAIAILEHAELIRLDAQRRLESGELLGDPTSFVQAKERFDRLARPLVAVAYAKGIEAQALAEFIRTGKPGLVQAALTVLDKLQAISLRANRDSHGVQGARLDETGAREAAEAHDLSDERRATEAPSGTAAPAPLSPAQQEVWVLLAGEAHLAKELAQKVAGGPVSDDSIRKRIAEMRKKGWHIENQGGVGYYRPDAPPPDQTGAERESG